MGTVGERTRTARREHLAERVRVRREKHGRLREDKRDARRVAAELLVQERMRRIDAIRVANRGCVEFRLRGGARLEFQFAAPPQRDEDGREFRPAVGVTWIQPDGEVRTIVGDRGEDDE
jgi:hypothetical protein